MQLFDVAQQSGQHFLVRNLFAESIARVGSVTTETSASVENCTFDLQYQYAFGGFSGIGKQTVITSNDKVLWSNNIIRYVGSGGGLKFSGIVKCLNTYTNTSNQPR